MLRRGGIVLALALVVVGVANAKTTGKVIGVGQTLKGAHGKIALIEVAAVKPSSLTVKVAASPKQSVKIDYSVVCVNSGDTDAEGYNPSASPKTGTAHITAPGSLVLPMPLKHPSSCQIAVYSTLSKTGKQSAQLIQN